MIKKLLKIIPTLSLTGTIVLSILYKTTSLEILLTFAITLGTITYHFAMRLFVAFLYRSAMHNRADYSRRWYQVSRAEMRFYEKLGVKRWKNKMPTYDPGTFDPRQHSWDEIAQATCQAELGHETIAVLSFLPILAGNVFQQLYSAVDTIIVGRTLGSDALASVGSIGSLQFFVFGFCSGLAGGVTVVTSQFIGAGKTENARRSTAVIYMIWAVVSLLCTVVGIVCLPGLLHILNMPENLFQRAYAYQLVCFIGLGGQLLYNVESSLLRAIGNSKVPLIFLIISSVLNIILDFVFILVFHMDVVGAACSDDSGSKPFRGRLSDLQLSEISAAACQKRRF